MLEFFDSLKNYDDEGGSYVFEIDKYMPNDYTHGKSDDDGYKIVYYGSRHLLTFPEVATFTMCCLAEFTNGYLGETDSVCGFVFHYDMQKQFRREISVRVHAHGGITMKLLQTENGETSVLKEEKYPFDRDTQSIFKVVLQSREKEVSLQFGDFTFYAPITAQKGRVGVYRGEAYDRLCVSNLHIKTEENFEEKTVFENKTFAIPNDNGSNEPYYIDMAVKQIGGVYRLDYKLWGGASLHEKKDSHSERTWAFPRDDMESPFVRIGQGKRLYLENRELRFVDDNYPNKPLHDMTCASYKKNYNVRDLPMVGCFYLKELPPFETLSFGYKNFTVSNIQPYCGANEFVYNLDGKILHRGAHLDDDYIVDVTSPLCQDIYEKMPKDVPMYELAVEHLKGNHYFTVHEKPTFTVEVLTKKPLDLLQIKVELKDAFNKEVIGSFTTEETTAKGFFNFNAKAVKLQTEKLPIGVYHAEITLIYAGEKVKTHTSAFEVLDMDKDICPAEASGLPTVYTGDCGPIDTLYANPEFVNTQPDCNITHYYTLGMYGSHAAQDRQVWKLLHLYKRKLMLWATGRTMSIQETLDPTVPQWDMMKNADVVNYIFPGIEWTKNYYRYDHYNPYNYKGDTIINRSLKEFLKEYPEYAEKLSFKEEREDFTDAQHAELMGKIGTPWIKYANAKIKALMEKQWAEVKKYNPKVKRHSYGPWSAYASPLVSAHSSKWYGFDPKTRSDTIDAFIQFEDYPFNCAYSTTRGAFGIMSSKFLCPSLVIAPELYVDFEAGCPDGLVDSGRPPHGIHFAPPYVQMTQLSEMRYSGWFKNGEYAFSEDGVANIFDFAMHDSKSRHQALIDAFYALNKNKAKRLYKAAAFVYDINEKEDRVDIKKENVFPCEYDVRKFYNVSEANEMHLHRVLRERGHGTAFLTSFDELKHLNKDGLDMLVLPSLEDITEEQTAEIMRLYNEGVPVFAVGNVGKLAYLFGVKENPSTVRVSYLTDGKQKEIITLNNAEIRYENVDAEVLLSTDNDIPVLLKKGNAVLLNCSVCQVGVDNFDRMPYLSINNISKLLYNKLDEALSVLYTPSLIVDGPCGTMLYETEDGRRNLVVIDYTDMDKDLIDGYQTRIVVRVNGLDIQKITDLGLSEKTNLKTVEKDGKIIAFSFTILPKQTLMFTLD